MFFLWFQALQDGFLIVACDGVWDELSNEQAVEIVDKVTFALAFACMRACIFHGPRHVRW